MKRTLKITLLSGLIFSNMFLVSGCWHYREIKDLAIVAGTAIDKEGDKYLLTTEIVNMSSGKEAKAESKLITATGDTIHDAIRNAIKISGKPLYWSHSDITILSEEVAREGVIRVIDLFVRDPEARMSANLLISKAKTAKEILELQSITSVIQSIEIKSMLASQKYLAKAPVIAIYEFLDALQDNGRTPVLPVVDIGSNKGKNVIELCGTAVFKRDRLVGFLDGEDTKYFLFAINKLTGGLFIQKESSDMNITLEIFSGNANTRIKPMYSNGVLQMKMDVHVIVSTSELQGSEDYIIEPGKSKLKRDAEESLEDNIKRVVKKVQNDYGSDIFGFGRIVKDNIPNVWRDMEKDWDNIYKNLDVTVNTDIKIKNSALFLESIKIGG